MLILPPECWADKNTHLYKAIELLQLKDTSALAIPFVYFLSLVSYFYRIKLNNKLKLVSIQFLFIH